MNCWNNYAIHKDVLGDGRIFHKSEEKDPFWHLCTGKERPATNYTKKDHDPVNVPEEIVCGCGGRTFHLAYGDYKIAAECSSCGKRDVVYDG